MDAHSKNHSDLQVYTGTQTTKATHGSNTVKCLICSHVQGEHAWNRAFCCCCRRHLCAPFSWAAERHKGSTESRAQQDPPDAAYPYSLLSGHGANIWKVTGQERVTHREETGMIITNMHFQFVTCKDLLLFFSLGSWLIKEIMINWKVFHGDEWIKQFVVAVLWMRQWGEDFFQSVSMWFIKRCSLKGECSVKSKHDCFMSNLFIFYWGDKRLQYSTLCTQLFTKIFNLLF